MKKKWFKIMLISIIVLLIGGSIFIMYLVNNQCMEKGQKVIFGTWGKKCSSVVDIKDDGKDYSKNVDNMEIKWHIPSSWNYEEVENTNNILFSLKLYKENNEDYALLNVYEDSYSVCGTGRTEDTFTLNNNQEVIIGYYNNTIWSDISFKDYAPKVAIINYSLKENEAKEILEFIKTIEITEN
uniref:hypothetical protein n=1 Tax=Candidatus Ventrenecus sp. TaxID=3085654 RepID=UPI004028568B